MVMREKTDFKRCAFRAAGGLAISGYGIWSSSLVRKSAALLMDALRLYLIDFGRDRRNCFDGSLLVSGPTTAFPFKRQGTSPRLRDENNRD